jgi:hypothetical protein
MFRRDLRIFLAELAGSEVVALHGNGRKHGTAGVMMHRVPQTDLLFGRAEMDEFVRFIKGTGAWLVPSHLNGSDVIRIL